MLVGGGRPIWKGGEPGAWRSLEGTERGPGGVGFGGGLEGGGEVREEVEAGRPIDLVAEGSLRPYARKSVDNDKVLVYERA